MVRDRLERVLNMPSGKRLRRFNPGVENADHLPVSTELVDECDVVGRGLVAVVGGLILEDDVQGDVEPAVVHLAPILIGEDPR